MAKKIKEISPKKALVSKIENTLTESLSALPKKQSDKKFKKTLHKAAGKIISKSILTKSKKAETKSKVKKSSKKSSIKKEKVKEQTA